MYSRYVKTEAIVLNSVQFGEGHNIINLFTESYGKVEASAFGVRKTKSRFGSKLEPFTISHFLLYHKSEDSLFTIKDVNVHFHNNSISGDFQKFIVGNSLIEPVILFVEKGQADRNLYRLLSDALKDLNEIITHKSIYLLSMYDIKFLSIMGYSPNISMCKKCGDHLNDKESYMDHYYGFPICERCKTGSSVQIYTGTLRFIEWVDTHSIAYSKKVTMEKPTLDNIRSVIEQLYLHTFHKKPQSWKQLSSY